MVVMLSPSMRREWIEICTVKQQLVHVPVSPSMRREWIEIPLAAGDIRMCKKVSLHAEGVD